MLFVSGVESNPPLPVPPKAPHWSNLGLSDGDSLGCCCEHVREVDRRMDSVARGRLLIVCPDILRPLRVFNYLPPQSH